MCPLCGRSAAMVSYVKAGCRYLRCRCGTLYQEHPPTAAQLRQLYQTYHEKEYGAADDYRAAMEPFFLAAAAAIGRRRNPPGRILDIGCANGLFLKMMRDRGWEVTGCELSESAAGEGRKRFGLDILCGDFNDLEWEGKTFDVIAAFYVIEHQLDPPAFLARLNGLLKPGGLLYLRFPHTTPLLRWADIVNRDHDLLHYPWHIVDIPPDGLRRAMERAGFRDISIDCGGSTRGEKWWGSALSVASSRVAALLRGMTFGLFILPGVSKNAVGVKDR
ncbi:MAG: hypothetical protein A2Z34_06315 [Planctomycetes bacterium RBG_16_59_8]|nr:MAG: hypothetical protein A2Z34_06315 [Planctomycetes bacterium RBG_16_59_8]